MAEGATVTPTALPRGPVGHHGLGWWGAGTLVASEAALFSYLLFAYYFTAASAPSGWLLEPRPRLALALPNTALLIASSFVANYGERGVMQARRGQALLGFAGALAMGMAFAVVQGFEWAGKSYGIGANSYASLYFVTTGLHMAHVAAGLLILAALTGWAAADYFSPRRRISVSAGVLYWHFVDIVWLFVFTTYYLTPYLGFGR